ncbi:MAG: MFS transporter [Coprococcus sp.]|nr:MFS transporter [Coprococcus sp.]
MNKNNSCCSSGKLSKKEIVYYGLGALAGTLPNQFKQQFSMNFMTDVGRLPIAAVGFWNMFLSIWDAVNDPIIGRFVDGTNTKRFGKYRPHMIFGSLLWAVTILLLFIVPPGSEHVRMAYYLVVLALFSVFYTEFTIPWQALNSVMSRDPHQRNLLLTSRQIVGAFATSAVGLFTVPVVSHFTSVRIGWFAAAAIVASLCVFSAFIASNSARRTDYYNSIPTKKQATFQELAHLLFCNKAVLCTGLLLGFVYMGISFNATISMYYLKYVVKNVGLLAPISVIKIIVTFIAMPFMPYLLKRFGKLRIICLSMLLQAGSALVLLILRENAGTIMVMFMSTVTTLGLTCANTGCFSLIPDCTDYTEIHFGNAHAGFINSVSTFVRKFFGAFSFLIVGGFLELSGYDAATQISQPVINMILDLKIWIPCILLGAVLIVIKIYPSFDRQ